MIAARGALSRVLAAIASVVALGCSPDAGPSDRGDAAAPPDRAAAVSAGWSEAEWVVMRSLRLDPDAPPPPSPGNRVADDAAAARLGHALFFDPGLSADGSVSCATCHQPERHFTDGLARSRGLGTAGRNAPSIVGAAHSPWQYWDGRRDSLWSQALSPLEADVEMGNTRTAVVAYVTRHPRYGPAYAELFGTLPPLGADVLDTPASPYGDASVQDAWAALDEAQQSAVDTAFANIGKSIAAYERRIAPGRSRFDRYVDALADGRVDGADDQLTADERAGLRLFADGSRSLCLRCHNGPHFSNHSFHRIGTARLTGIDFGRFLGIQSLLLDPFNCIGPYSDADPDDCGAIRFLDQRETGRLSGAFKTPSLRSVSRTAPYMHDGGFATLEAVLEHYRDPPPLGGTPHELTPMDWSDRELTQLAAFLRALDGGVAADPRWLRPPDGRNGGRP